MESNQQIALSVFLVVFLGFFLSLSQSHMFYVGGKDGWVVKPKEDYNIWAERNRFQINDTLVFIYKKGYDTVLEVGKEDYHNCYKENPLQARKGGVSLFQFNRSGPFFFISGHANNCQKGQRLIVVVLHPRGNTNKASSPIVVANSLSPSPSPSPSPATTASSIFAPTPSPIKANSYPPAAPKIIPTVTQTPTPGLIIDQLAPAPAPSSATVFGGTFGPVLGLSLLITVAFGHMF